MKPVKILVIDDEPAICKGCRLSLADENHLVEICMTGQEGLRQIGRENYDVILLDMKLPDIEGMEILRAISKNKQGPMVIIMTGYSTVQSAVEAMRLGAFDYISKPFSDEELILTVQRAVEKKRLIEENIFLRTQIFSRSNFPNIIGESPKILQVLEQIERVAPTDSTVLILGESGTGKELVAEAIHARSQRNHRQFIAVDCSTLSPSLLESELFGHVKGAFTGAIKDKEGIFSLANGGTLFMDDVTNLSLEVQGKLLRVLETGEYKPVGASHFQKTDVRVIAATNRELKAMVEEKQFREDLYYRLNVFPIFLPPLRERKEDIPKLAYHFLRHFCKKTGKRIEGFTDEALENLINYEWPGNVRQLKNIVERLVIMADETKLDLFPLADQLQLRSFKKSVLDLKTWSDLKALKKQILEETFGQIQKRFLINALRATNGNITQAAKRVGMQRPNFCTLLKKHHISPAHIKNAKKSDEQTFL